MGLKHLAKRIVPRPWHRGRDEVVIRDAYEERGLSIVEPIHYGSWCARPHYLSFQDIVVARKQ